MQYTQVKNPKWSNAEHTSIDCEVNFVSISEEFVPFTAIPNDLYQHTREIFARCVAGDFGTIAEYETPEHLTYDSLCSSKRAERNILLLESDWTQLPDVPEETKQLWATYRQALRDITEQSGYPTDIQWPIPPNN
jgi:hypothetical protein